MFSIGGGLLNTPITTAVTAGVPAADTGAASGLMNTTEQVGAALGLAALITATVPSGSTAAGVAEGHSRAFCLIAAAMVAVAAVALPAHRNRK
ncbi:hypothetical protein [Nocardia sp. NPDC057455]|uniref:hypothetical protein n=1 Tax=Nocardia sp. NPDC057455 TaxID=3346138 RepID=UPI00366CD85A